MQVPGSSGVRELCETRGDSSLLSTQRLSIRHEQGIAAKSDIGQVDRSEYPADGAKHGFYIQTTRISGTGWHAKMSALMKRSTIDSEFNLHGAALKSGTVGIAEVLLHRFI